MKKVICLVLTVILSLGAAIIWAGTSNSYDGEILSTSNVIEQKAVYQPENSNIAEKAKFYDDISYCINNSGAKVVGDSCDNPFVITSLPYSDTQYDSTYSDDYGQAGPDIVYQFTISECQDVTMSLCNSEDNTLDLLMYLYADGDCGGSYIAIGDDECVESGYGTPELIERLEAGTYYLIVDAYTNQFGYYTLDVTASDCPEAPPYDECSEVDPTDNLLVLNGSLNYTGDNTGATLDAGCADLTTEQSWIGFYTTEELDVTIEFCGTDPVRSGYYRVLSDTCPCSGEFYYATDEDTTSCADANVTLFFQKLPAGQYYYPVIGGDSEGAYTITVTAAEATGYCEFTCPGGITSEGEDCGEDLNGGCNSDDLTFGTVTAGEHICGELYGDGGTRDTDWFEFIPATDTFISWSAVGSVPISIILIDFTAGCADTEYVYLGGNGAIECDTATAISVVEAGHNIACFVSTDAIYSGYPCENGPFYYEAWLDLLTPGIPANDNCADAIEIGEVTDYEWGNLGATTDNLGNCDSYLQSDVWYRYTAASDGVATLSLCDATEFDTFIGVFEDDCGVQTCINYNDDGCGTGGGPSIVEWDVVSGESYLLCLGGWAGGMGVGEFDLTVIVPPAIGVDPTSVTGSAAEGESDTEIVTVSNTGDSTLEFEAYTTQDFVDVTAAKISAANNEQISNNPMPFVVPGLNLPSSIKHSLTKPDEPTPIKSANSVIDLRENKHAESLTTAEYCEVIMTNAVAAAFGPSGATYEYAVYQDPGICETDPYPFQIDSLSCVIRNSSTAIDTIYWYLAFYEADLTDPTCPVPGELLGSTETYYYAFPASTGYIFTLDAPTGLYVDGPFFMSICFPYEQTNARVYITAEGDNYSCYTYFTYSDIAGTWYTFYDAFGYERDLCSYYYTMGTTQTGPVESCDIECPVDAIAEGEECVDGGADVTNGGCNSDPVVFGTIDQNTSICGTTWATGGYRDTDWYNLVLDSDTYIQITLMPEFPAVCYILDATDCDSILAYAAISVSYCDTGTISGTLPAGTYTIFVAPSTTTGILCDLSGTYYNEYILSLDCMPVWLDINTYSGSAPPSVPITVTMDATYLTDGTYTGSLIIESNDEDNPIVTVPVTFNVISCFQYVPGDANMINGAWPPQVIGGDVTYLVNYFRGINLACKVGGYYCAADANGDCQVIGSDVTKMVNYFRGITALSHCANYEPCWHSASECPSSEPTSWPNCE